MKGLAGVELGVVALAVVVCAVEVQGVAPPLRDFQVGFPGEQPNVCRWFFVVVVRC